MSPKHFLFAMIFSMNGPLGQFFHRVAMSVYISVFMSPPNVFPGFSRGFPRVFPGFSRDFPGVFPGFSWGFLRIVPGCSRGLPGIFPGFSQGFPLNSRKIMQPLKKKKRKNHPTSPKLFRSYYRHRSRDFLYPV